MAEHRWTGIAVWPAAGSLAVVTLIWSSGSDMFIGMMLLVVLGGWGLLGVFGIGSFVRAAMSRSAGWLRQWAVVWLFAAAALVGSVAVGLTGVPESVRVELSKAALIDAGQQVLAGEHPQRAGLYGFSHTSVSGGCAILETGTFAIDSFGFAYCPTEPRPGFEPLGGGLFAYAYD